MLTQIVNRDKRLALFKAIESAGVEHANALEELKKLPKHTIDGVEPVPEGMFENLEDNTFAIAVTVSVLMHGSLYASELFPGEAQGHFHDNVAVVDKLTVNASSFFD